MSYFKRFSPTVKQQLIIPYTLNSTIDRSIANTVAVSESFLNASMFRHAKEAFQLNKTVKEIHDR